MFVGGCSSDADVATDSGEVMAPTSGVPIAFTAMQQEEQAVTRAALADKGVTAFTVYGFKNMSHDETNGYTDPQLVFPGYTVKWADNTAATSTTNSNGWEYVNQQALGKEEQTIKYWDWAAEAYRFFAVAGATGTNEVKGVYETPEIYKVTYKADANKVNDTPYYSHLWFSTGKPNYPTFGQPVQLEFIKPLSKVRIIFIFEEYDGPAVIPASGTSYACATSTELTDISFSPTNGNTIKLKGDVTVRYPLTGADATETFEATAEAEGITAFTQDYFEETTKEIESVEYNYYPYKNAGENGPKEYTVLPVTGQGTYTLLVNVDGEPKSTIVPAEYMNWKPGYLYTYIFKVHADKGVSISSVQSAFTKWEIHYANHTIYNW